MEVEGLAEDRLEQHFKVMAETILALQKRLDEMVANGGSQMTGLSNLIAEAMAELGSGKVARVDEPLFTGSNGASKMARQMPRHFWQILT